MVTTVDWDHDFWAKVHPEALSGCWLWHGAASGNGYGSHRGRYAHRVAYELAVGAIPAGHDVRHSCDVRMCVNPSHLSHGTRRQNVHDAISRDRHARGERVPGHRLVERDVVAMRHARANGARLASLASAYGVDLSTARDACVGRTWKHILDPSPVRLKRPTCSART